MILIYKIEKYKHEQCPILFQALFIKCDCINKLGTSEKKNQHIDINNKKNKKWSLLIQQNEIFTKYLKM